MTFALQVYCPAWELRSGSKVRVRVVVLPEVIELSTDMPFPPTMVLPLKNRHSTVGSTTRFLTTTAVQVRVYIRPAVDIPAVRISNCGAGSASVDKERVL